MACRFSSDVAPIATTNRDATLTGRRIRGGPANGALHDRLPRVAAARLGHMRRACLWHLRECFGRQPIAHAGELQSDDE
jgi:hypothetical protein